MLRESRRLQAELEPRGVAGIFLSLGRSPGSSTSELNGRSGVDDGEFEFGAGDDLAVDGAGGDGGADGAAEAEDLGVDEEGVAGDDGLAEFDFVGAEEVADFPLIIRKAHDEDGGGLGHGLELEDAGHDGVSGEVALEEFLIHGEVLDGGALHFGREADDAVY